MEYRPRTPREDVPTWSSPNVVLHDGRARNLLEAILWHGGEAESVKQRYVLLPPTDRVALQVFLESL